MSGRLWTVLAALLLAACSGVRVQQFTDPRLPQLRAAGYRIAVLPLSVSAPEEGFLESALGPVGEVLALEGGAGLPDRMRLAAVLRTDVVTWLRQTPFEVVDTWVTDTQLLHAGMPGGGKASAAQAARIAALLQVDGVVFGDVTRWNRSYYVVQSTAEVGLSLELRDAGTGDLLFSTERVETIGSGVSGGPTGFVSAATEPVAGLRGSHLRELMRSATRNAALDLGGGELGGEPLPGAPRLALVSLARAHAGPVRAGERIDVVAVGTPGCEVRFDLGRLRVGVPMQETAVADAPAGARATYAGHYVVQPGDPAGAVPLYCSIKRRAARALPSRYRWDGNVELGR